MSHPELTYDTIEAEAFTFAKNYLLMNDVPPLPKLEVLAKYKEMLETKYVDVVTAVKAHVAQFEPEGGHGYEHLEDVALRAAELAERECGSQEISPELCEKIINLTLLAGLLHDVDRHLGRGEDHMTAGAETAAEILKPLNLFDEIIFTVVQNHDHLDFDARENKILAIIFGAVFDADHFRYGWERTDTFWRMMQKSGATPEKCLHEYGFLEKFLPASVWKTQYGREVGPRYIELAIAIAEHVKQFFEVGE